MGELVGEWEEKKAFEVRDCQGKIKRVYLTMVNRSGSSERTGRRLPIEMEIEAQTVASQRRRNRIRG